MKILVISVEISLPTKQLMAVLHGQMLAGCMVSAWHSGMKLLVLFAMIFPFLNLLITTLFLPIY
jgi:hypothetical protein